jgi:hypothetical protein
LRGSTEAKSIYSLEHGQKQWAWPPTVRKLADTLGVEPKELMDGEE